jgi:hypothetical protein
MESLRSSNLIAALSQSSFRRSLFTAEPRVKRHCRDEPLSEAQAARNVFVYFVCFCSRVRPQRRRPRVQTTLKLEWLLEGFRFVKRKATHGILLIRHAKQLSYMKRLHSAQGR